MSEERQNDDSTTSDEAPRLQLAITTCLLEGSHRRWLTIPQAAIELGISEAAVRTLCRNRKIEHKREGTRGRGGKGTILIERKVIDAYNSQQRVTPLVKVEPRPTLLRKRRKVVSPHLEPEKWGCV